MNFAKSLLATTILSSGMAMAADDSLIQFKKSFDVANEKCQANESRQWSAACLVKNGFHGIKSTPKGFVVNTPNGSYEFTNTKTLKHSLGGVGADGIIYVYAENVTAEPGLIPLVFIDYASGKRLKYSTNGDLTKSPDGTVYVDYSSQGEDSEAELFVIDAATEKKLLSLKSAGKFGDFSGDGIKWAGDNAFTFSAGCNKQKQYKVERINGKWVAPKLKECK